jgi:hypothetical protein
VDGSCILALPTDEPFEGGALHVWDGKPKQAPKSGDDINMMKHEYIYTHTYIYIHIYMGVSYNMDIQKWMVYKWKIQL